MKRFKPTFCLSTTSFILKWWLFQFTIFSLTIRSCMWKWKYESIRVEHIPHLELIIFNIKIDVYFGTDEDWENYLTKKHNND